MRTAARPAVDRALRVPADVSGAALAEILHRLATLETTVDRVRVLLEARPVRRPVDPAADGALLSALAAHVGARVFSASDVLDTSDAELRAAVAGVDAHALGVWLRRLRRAPMAPYRLHRIGRDGAGALWRIECR